MGKYFNTEENFGRHSSQTLRIQETDGFQIMKGGMIDQKGKLKQADVIAWTETREEAEMLIKKLCEL